MWEQVWARLAPTAPPALALRDLAVVVAVAVLCVGFAPVWRVVRVGVTLVHELGHAFVGVLVGRRFSGFVLRADMSGHAVTVGRPRGLGRVLTTWAGYPMPGLLAAGMAALVWRGYAGALLAALALALLVALPRVRSLLTFVAVGIVLAGAVGLFWWGSSGLQTLALLVVAVILLAGGWRHVAAVAGAPRGSGSDPEVLRDLTGAPAPLWVVSFVLVLAGSTWAMWRLASG